MEISNQTANLAPIERCTGLGGHDIAAICGVHPFRTAVQVYQEKVERISTFDPNYAQRRALFLEEFMGAEFAAEKGAYFENKYYIEQFISNNPLNQVNSKPYVLKEGWKIVHPEYEFFHAHPDFILTEEEDQSKILKVVECKDPRWLDPTEWGVEGEFSVSSRTVPDYITCQVAWYCMVAGCEEADLIVNDDSALRHYIYKRNPDFESILINAGLQFWMNHYVKRIPPDAGSLHDVHSLYPVASEQSIELEGEIFNEVIALKALQAEIKELEKKVDEKKMLIQKRMGKASEATFNGVRVCTWKGYEVSRVNTSNLRRDFPEIYDELVEKTYQRRFMLK